MAGMPEATPQLGYRPSLNGLRGIAVALVIGDHLGIPGLARAGWLGVTLFFVLSGFLITTLLIEERQRSGRVNLRAFLKRRALRILPALVFMLVIAAIWLTATGRLQDVAYREIPILAYSSNVLMAAGANFTPFAHTWSLGLEEQFYLLWPALFALLAWRAGWRAIGILLLLAAVSTVLRIVLAEDYNRAAWGPDTRADALLIGCALGFAFKGGRWWTPGTWALGVAAIAGIVAMQIDDNRLALIIGVPLSILASATILSAAVDGRLRLLEWRPLVLVGLVSYGLYLWHEPIILETQRLAGLNFALPLGTIDLVLIATLASISYRWVERPFLRRRRSVLANIGSDVTAAAGRPAGITAP